MQKAFIQSIVGSAQEFDIDARILNGSCFITGVAGLIAGLLTIWPLTVGPAMLAPCFAGAFVGFLGWHLGRRYRLFSISFILLLLTQLLSFTVVFLFYGGSTGPASLFFATWVPVYIYIFQAPQTALIALLFFTTYSGLYFLELYHYITPPHSNADGTLDFYAAFVIHFILTAVVAVCAKTVYQNAQQKIQAASQAKSKFLANISHEIRTPMNALMGMNDLALERCTDTQQKIWLEKSQVAAKHLLSLMEDLLDISSINEGKLNIMLRPVCLRDLVNDVMDIMQPLALQKNLSLNLQFSETLPAHIEMDPGRLRQIIVNLLNNAIKFTDVGHILVTVNKQSGADLLIISIHDTGVGISAAEQEKVFEVFTQGGPVDAARRRGFGLGLSISKHLIEKMGGTITLESQPGKGSTFTFTLPLIEAVEEPAATPVTPTISTSSEAMTTSPQHILLVEDNEINIEVAQLFLQKNNFMVTIAVNGQEALKLLAQHPYAAVLMDLEMPVMDGIATTKALRAGLAGSLNQHTPVIALTAHALVEYQEKSFEAGMNGFIRKPINGAALLDEIHCAIA